jgi:SAM-dependent methyltransferase
MTGQENGSVGRGAGILVDSQAAPSERWNREYETLRVIPSSTRDIPSKALLLFSELLDFENAGLVLDVGCGNGRNAVYLARQGCTVHALDFSKAALDATKSAALRAGLDHRIRLYSASLLSSLPWKDDTFDLVIDSYVFCHFTDEQVKRSYIAELGRVARPGGIVFCSAFATDDQYYQPLINSDDQNPVVVDPRNGITKQLYTIESLSGFFDQQLDIRYQVTLQFWDEVQGEDYLRKILVVIVEPPSE